MVLVLYNALSVTLMSFSFLMAKQGMQGLTIISIPIRKLSLHDRKFEEVDVSVYFLKVNYDATIS